MDILNNLRSGNVDYVYKQQHIDDLLQYEPCLRYKKTSFGYELKLGH